MDAQLVSNILTHMSAFFLGVSATSFAYYHYLTRKYKLYNNCCPPKNN